MELDKVVRVQQEHTKDLLRQAEQYHLVQQALAARPQQPSSLNRLFTWLGQQIANLSCLLQKIFSGEVRRTAEPKRQVPCGEEA